MWHGLSNLDTTKSMMKHKVNGYGSIKSELLRQNYEAKLTMLFHWSIT